MIFRVGMDLNIDLESGVAYIVFSNGLHDKIMSIVINLLTIT